jgi:transcriptional regulator with XRE-family HTH domain
MTIPLQTFGDILRSARQEKGYSQRVLAQRIGVNFTYLSKLENNRADYPPSEEVIQALADHLDLDSKTLFYLAGRVPQEVYLLVQQLVQVYQQQLPVILKAILDYPEQVQLILRSSSTSPGKEEIFLGDPMSLSPDSIKLIKQLVVRAESLAQHIEVATIADPDCQPFEVRYNSFIKEDRDAVLTLAEQVRNHLNTLPPQGEI